MANSMERFVRSVTDLSKRLENLERNNQSQRFTSVEKLEFRNQEGEVVGNLGLQEDGSFDLVHEAPPSVEDRPLVAPNAPLLDTQPGAILVTNDGATEVPRDFSEFEIHISEEAGFVADETTHYASIYTVEGSTYNCAPFESGEYYVSLRVRLKNGLVSEPSPTASVEVTGFDAVIQQILNDAQNLIDDAKAQLETGQTELADKLSGAEDALAQLADDLENIDVDIDLTEIENAISDAQQAASEAKWDAQQAQNAALNAPVDISRLTENDSEIPTAVAQRIAAQTGLFLQLGVDQLVANEALIDEAVINKLFSDVVVSRMSQAESFIGGNAILSGAVTATHITASESLSAKIGQFLEVKASQVETDFFVGRTIRTAKTGARVEMTSTGLKQFDASNRVITNMSGGSLEMVGSLFTGIAGENRTVLNQNLYNLFQDINDTNEDNPYLEDRVGSGIRIGNDQGTPRDFGELHYSASSTGGSKRIALVSPHGAAYRTELRLGDAGLSSNGWEVGARRLSNYRRETRVWGTRGSVGMEAQGTTNVTGGPLVRIGGTASTLPMSNVLRMMVRQDSSAPASAYTGSDIVMRQSDISMFVQGGVSKKASIDLDNAGAIDLRSTADLTLGTSNGNSLVFKGSGSANFVMNAAGWQWANYYQGSATANVHMTSGGWFQRTGSSRRWKIAEEPLSIDDDKLLSIKPKTWYDKSACERWAELDTLIMEDAEFNLADNRYVPDELVRIPGLIAEDLDKAGLEIFVEYNQEGEPVGVLYDRIGPALIPIVSKLRDQINSLEERLSLLESA